ncbi:MAG: phosphate ABC transporter substrate-binding protein PstS [Thermoleophilia bacterium]|nr:phosphate ABC transporter substrate-binding protein PstS [Thermoleophilia bacterium]
MRSKNLLALTCCAVLALAAAACGSNDSNPSSGGSSSSSGSGGSAKAGGTINGAGATFPQPVYQEWAARFKETNGTTVNYQGIGSGGGVAQFSAGTDDFGASDAPLKVDEIATAKKKGSDPVHVPTVLGAVTVSYNLDGVQQGLKLDGKTAADIFLGKVKKWNDPEIASQNSGVKLPSDNITVCHRSDSSGTTKNFAEFLADYSPAWKNGPGVDKEVKWPTGTGAKGNDGVAGCVKQTKGAVGYVEQAYALQNKFTTAAVKNSDGKYVEPSLQATAAAGTNASPPEDLRFSTINAKGADTYPISAVTFLLVWQDMCKAGMKPNQAKLVKDWLNYALGPGQQVASQLQYAPLPDGIKTKAQAKVDGLQCNGQAIAAS